jgi:2,4-dienoyl-CoA reductase-like NADH-dependent reductase (Old Yellow Enzyme family)
MVLRNRIIMPPMNTELATEEGEVTEEIIQHYGVRAPWLGLVIVEHSYVAPGGRLSPRQPGVHDDRLEDGLGRLARAIKESGTPAAIQINHAGMKTDPALTGEASVGPSPTNGSDEMAAAGMEEIVSAFGKAAAMAVRSGFDVVEVHGAHGFLLNQFASPLTNMRQDEYGGSLENRMRFPLEVVRRVRQETGSGVHLWYRLGADDRSEGGNTIEDGVRMAKMLSAAGVEVMDVSGGICGSRPADLAEPGYYAYAAKAVKDAAGLPVVAVGGVKTVEQAEQVLARWGVDLVAVGRAILSDPLWGKKACE